MTKRSKKILIDARMYGLENAGIGRYILNLIEELKNLATEEQFIILLRKKYFEKLEFPSNWKKVKADFHIYGFEEQIKLPFILWKEKPDLVHFPHCNIPIFWFGTFVVTLHDLTMQKQGTDATKLPLPIYYFKRMPFYLAFYLAAKRSRKVLVPTKYVKEDIENYYHLGKNKVIVTYEGITALPDSDNKALDYKSPYFFYVGNAYPHKNLSRAIEAIKILNENMRKKTLFIIGGSKTVFTDRLNNLIRKLGVSEYVKLVGFIDDNNMKNMYRNSIGFLYPSLSEGVGLQGLEAMSAGTLVLASNVPVFREAYGDNAIYFEPFDPKIISEAMERAINISQDQRQAKIKKSQLFVKKYSWKKMASETLEVYNSVLNGQKTTP